MAARRRNFLLVGPLPDAHDVFRRLLDAGVLVRETSVPGCLRVSIGTPAENERFRTALRDEVRELTRRDRQETGDETKEHR